MKYDIRNSWLNDENIAKRALAVFGYNLLGYLIVLGGLFVVALFISIITGNI